MDSESYFSARPDIASAKKTNQDIATKEGQTGWWALHKQGLESYQNTFQDLWPKKIEGGVALDIMGDGQYIRDLQAQGINVKGIAVALADSRSETIKVYDTAHGNELITGDILSGKTWKDIEEKLHGQECGLIVCRGEGGFALFPRNENFGLAVFNKAYKLLGENGQILTQVPYLFRDQLPALAENAKNSLGASVEYRIPSSNAQLAVARVQKTTSQNTENAS